MELLPLSRFFSSLAAPNPTVGSLLLGSLQDTVQLLEVAGKLPVTVGVINNVDKPYVPPSRKNRKFFTTWIDKAALKELRDL